MKLTVKVTPKSSESKIMGEMADGTLKIKLKSAPIEGKANTELINLLAKYFKTAKSNIEILKGETGKNKIIEIKC